MIIKKMYEEIKVAFNNGFESEASKKLLELKKIINTCNYLNTMHVFPNNVVDIALQDNEILKGMQLKMEIESLRKEFVLSVDYSNCSYVEENAKKLGLKNSELNKYKMYLKDLNDNRKEYFEYSK